MVPGFAGPVAAALAGLLLLSQHSSSQEQRVPFRLDADAARFFAAESLSHAEVYYAVPEAGLTYAPDSGGWRGAVLLSIAINDAERVVASRSWTVPRTVAALPIPAPANIISFESLALPVGEYRIVLSAADSLDPSRRDSVVLPLSAPAWPATGPSISDVELCSRVTPGAAGGGLFHKNTLEVLPNPSRLYGAGLPVLHFYAEIYRLDAVPGPDVLMTAAILDGRGREVAAQSKSKPRLHPSSVEFGSMNVAGLPGGSYLFRVTLTDTAASPPRILASSERRFFVYNPAVAGDTGAGTGTQVPADRVFSFLSEAEADDEIRKLRYILRDRDRDQIGRLTDLEGKRNFLREFWRSRAAAGEEFGEIGRDAHLARIRTADERFGERHREGWLSDRGRVFVIYGPPDEIERHPSMPESRPYELWEYRGLQGGVIFVFVDRLGFGGYRLVHSTHLNELRNEQWFQDEAAIR